MVVLQDIGLWPAQDQCSDDTADSAVGPLANPSGLTGTADACISKPRTRATPAGAACARHGTIEQGIRSERMRPRIRGADNQREQA
jgi:hypothetical protein